MMLSACNETLSTHSNKLTSFLAPLVNLTYIADTFSTQMTDRAQTELLGRFWVQTLKKCTDTGLETTQVHCDSCEEISAKSVWIVNESVHVHHFSPEGLLDACDFHNEDKRQTSLKRDIWCGVTVRLSFFQHIRNVSSLLTRCSKCSKTAATRLSPELSLIHVHY